MNKLIDAAERRRLFLDLSHFTDDMPVYLFDDTMHGWRRGPLLKLVGEELARLSAPIVRMPPGKPQQ